VQPDDSREVGEPDAVAVARDRLEDRESAAERLHADALAPLGLVVDLAARRRDQPGELAGRDDDRFGTRAGI
jgi:hypothetical protein